MDKKKIVSEDFEEKKKDNSSNVNQDKKTKSMSKAQKAVPILIVAIVSLVVILTCVLIAYYQVNKTNTQNANVLEGVYASSYYSMVDNINNLSVDITKFSNASTDLSKASLLQDMSLDCNYVLAGLSVLPINQENIIAVTKFFNQVNGVCESYQIKLFKGESLTTEETLLLEEIGLVLTGIKNSFNKQNYSMYDTNFSFVDAAVFDKSGMNELSSSMGDMTSKNIEYPSMIFDGPFSTALETKEVKGLGATEVSKEEAHNYLKNTVYANRNDVKIEFATESSSQIATYDFNVKIAKKKFSVKVSKAGCLLITISGYANSGDARISSEQALEMAKTFANNVGFENMETVWFEQHDNVAYINLASTQDGIILYPDMVKIKIDMTSNEIIGLEALNYAYNHTQRDVEFNLLPSEAEELLGFDYHVLKENKTVIKLDTGKEIAAYEFMLERMDGVYFYYIDANNNTIAKVMKLVSMKGVEKLI